MSTIEIHTGYPEDPFSYPQPLSTEREGYLGLVAMYDTIKTLLRPPAHLTRHKTVEDTSGPHPYAIDGDVQQSLDNMSHILKGAKLSSILTPPANQSSLEIASILMQFTDHMPRAGKVIEFDAQSFFALHQATVEHSEKIGKPLDFSDQLSKALELHDGDITTALWNLFITSRQNARWLDSSTIKGLPEMSDGDVINHMRNWRKSIIAYKAPLENGAQDPAGDTYYLWTHALAKVLFRENTLLKKTFHHGTFLMHTLIHHFSEQSVVNNHSKAASIGNKIGERIVELAI